MNPPFIFCSDRVIRSIIKKSLDRCYLQVSLLFRYSTQSAFLYIRPRLCNDAASGNIWKILLLKYHLKQRWIR